MWRKKKIGIALSGGAARALCHIGVLEFLEELGVEADIVAGTSMGAVIGAIYCSGTPLKEIKEYVDSMDWRSFLLFSDLALSNTGMINGKRVEQVLKSFLGEKTFSDCSKKFCCIAVDMFSRKRVILSEGKLIDAVRASISIPGFFAPVRLNDMLLVDGGIIEPLPTKAIKEYGADIVIASSISFEKDQERYKTFQEDERPAGDDAGKDRKTGIHMGLFKNKLRGDNPKAVSVQFIIDTSFNIMQKEMTKKYEEIANIVINSEVGDFGFFDLTKGSEIIKRGRAAARSKEQEIKRKLRIR